MSVLDQIGFFQNQRDEVANQELAHQLAAAADVEGIREIAENLWNKKNIIRADCIKVMYGVGFLKPELVAPYADDFLRLLVSRNNRLVWGGMYALSCIAPIKANQLFKHLPTIEKAMEQGS